MPVTMQPPLEFNAYCPIEWQGNQFKADSYLLFEHPVTTEEEDEAYYASLDY